MITRQLTDVVDPKNIELLKEKMALKMNSNDDGFFLQSDLVSIRTMHEKKSEKFLKKMSLKNAMVHFRIASTGVKTQPNVHGWVKDDTWQFIHNGSVGEQVFYNQQANSDSSLFFDDIIYNIKNRKSVTDQEIAEVIKDCSSMFKFFGRAALYNLVTDKMYLFGSWYVYNVKNEFVAFSSSFLTFDKPDEQKHDIHGLEFKTVRDANVVETTFDAVTVIKNFSKPNFKFEKITDMNFIGWNKGKDARTVYTISKLYLEKQKKPKPEYGYDGWKDYRKPDSTVKEKAELEDIELNFELDEEINYLKKIERDSIINDYGEEVTVYQDETGLHDIDNNCCKDKTCERLRQIYYEEEGISYLAQGWHNKSNSRKPATFNGEEFEFDAGRNLYIKKIKVSNTTNNIGFNTDNESYHHTQKLLNNGKKI